MNFLKKNNLSENQIWTVLTGLLLIIIIFQLRGLVSSPQAKKISYGTSKEILQIKALTIREEQIKLYRNLIERVGATDAQEELLYSGLPFTGETHLLNHTVGDYLYEKYGSKGLVQCKDYFLSSCYHGFILHAIAEGGMTAVAETFAECLKYGVSVYSQCSHGIGHGFLANGGYKNLVKALETCDEAERTIPGFPPFNCYDGVFMENIWAVHDGKPSPDRWVKESDPFYPCNDKRINSKYLLGCWSNQPALAYQLFKGDLSKVAREVCDKVAIKANKEMCFNGLSRQIHPLTKGETQKTFELCSVMPTREWRNYCAVINAGANYAVGDRITSFEICAAIEVGGKNDCYQKLFSYIRAYKKAGDNTKMLCLKIRDAEYRVECEKI